MDEDRQHMRRALGLARRGLGYVEPNPPVGCVMVAGAAVVGSGWHRRFGGAHAEIDALREAGEKAAGATVYVTLEPCAHHGKTPPCVEALIEAGVRRVVIGAADPNPEAAGGIARLREAGVAVEVGVEEAAASDLIRAFARRQQRGRPWVIAKWAATVDGAIATESGDSQWISNPDSRREVHRLRARCDAVLVGIGTVLADDPRLTARGVRVRRRARRVVVDPRLRLPEDGQLMRTLDEAPLTVATADAGGDGEAGEKAERLREAGVEVVTLPMVAEVGGVVDRIGRTGARLDLHPLLRHLAEVHDATWVLSEGGAGLTAAMAGQDLVDELWVFTAPRLLIGGRGAMAGPFSGQTTRMADARRLSLKATKRVGEDVWTRYTVGRGETGD